VDTIEKYKEYVDTSIFARVEPIVFDRAYGAEVFGEDGRRYIDCFASISVTNVGHGNNDVLKAAKAQLDKYVHCCSYIYHSKPMADLAEKLAQITPGRLKKSFFTNSGTEANEAALKMARHYTKKQLWFVISRETSGRNWNISSAVATGYWATFY
jgi:4-aminobutyrate aminotransferase/(S)-3-amino-2-methylpropionate transaminase